MRIKFINNFLLVVLIIPLVVSAVTAKSKGSNAFSGEFNLTLRAQNDDIAPGKSVFKSGNKNYERNPPPSKRTADPAASKICRTDNYKQPNTLANATAKVNTGGLAQKSVLLGDGLFKAGKYREAITAYQKSLKLKPSYQAYLGLGNANFELKENETAAKAFEQAVKLNPKLDNAFYHLGLIRYQQKNYLAALSALQQCVAIAPAEADKYYYYGLTLSELKRQPEAVAALTEAIKLNPKFTDAYGKLGSLYLELNRQPEAIELLRQSIKANPNDGNAFFNLGNIYYNDQKQINALLPVLKDSVRLKPNTELSVKNLGDTYYILKNPPEAVKNYQRALQLKPELKNDFTFALRYGNSLRQANNWVDGTAWLIEASHFNPKDDNAFFLLGYAYLESQPPNYSLAIEALNQAAKINSSRKETFILLMRAHLQNPQGNNAAAEAARGAAERIQQLTLNNAVMQSDIGSSLSAGQLWEPATQAFKEAIRLDPKNGGVHAQLCHVYFVLKNYETGLPECEQAVNLSAAEDKLFARTVLASMYALGKRYNDAIAENNAVIKENPDFVFAYYSLGLTYSIMKKSDKAIDALKKAINLQPEMSELHYRLGLVYLDAKKKPEYLQEYSVLLNLNPKLAEQLKAEVEAGKKK